MRNKLSIKYLIEVRYPGDEEWILWSYFAKYTSREAAEAAARAIEARGARLEWRVRRVRVRTTHPGILGQCTEHTDCAEHPELGRACWLDQRRKNTPHRDPDRRRNAMKKTMTTRRRLPGPRPTMTYAIFHPVTGVKKVYKGIKNKDACHRLAVSWARKYKKNVRLTLLSSNAMGARPFRVTAKGKWVSKQKVKNSKAPRRTKYMANGQGGWKLTPRKPAKKAVRPRKRK